MHSIEYTTTNGDTYRLDNIPEEATLALNQDKNMLYITLSGKGVFDGYHSLAVITEVSEFRDTSITKTEVSVKSSKEFL